MKPPDLKQKCQAPTELRTLCSNAIDTVDKLNALIKAFAISNGQHGMPQSEAASCLETAHQVAKSLMPSPGVARTRRDSTPSRVSVLRLPAVVNHPALAFYYAEFLWQRAELESDPKLVTERWEKAARQFSRVVALAPVDVPLKEAAYAAVLSWKYALAVDPHTMRPVWSYDDQQDTSEPVPIPKREQALISAVEDYIRLAKDADVGEVTRLNFLRVGVLLHYEHLEEARPILQAIVTDHLTSEVGEYAVNMLLDTLIRTQRYDELVAWGAQLRSNTKFLRGREELAERLHSIHIISLSKNAELLERDGKYSECGAAYRAIDAEEVNVQNGDAMLYNAGVCFGMAGDSELAIHAFRDLLAKYPRSRHRQKALVGIGNQHEAVANYAAAAEAYEVYAHQYGGELDAPNAMFLAMEYRRALGDDEGVIRIVNDFSMRYGRKLPSEAAAAVFSLVQIYERRGSVQLVKHLQRYLKEFGRQGSKAHLVASYAKLGEAMWKAACRKSVDGRCTSKRFPKAVLKAQFYFKQAIEAAGHVDHNTMERDDESEMVQYWESAAHFYLAEGYNEQQEKSLLAEQLYKEITEEGAALWVIASFARLGQSQRLTDPARATIAYLACLEKSQELKLSNKWTRLCQREVAATRPDLSEAAEVKGRARTFGPVITRSGLSR